jgi:UDP-N-acetylglucosamine 2-epimerase
MRKRLARLRRKAVLETWLRLERRYLFPPRPEYDEMLGSAKPSLVVATNATTTRESELISSARNLGIPTLGIVGSWDRLHKHLHTRTDYISVWSNVNRQEAIDLEGFGPDRVHVTGPAQFDAYFDQSAIWSKAEFCNHFDLDPSRPIIVLATAGSFVTAYDETYLLDWLLGHIERGAIPANAQIICRLHPHSRLEYFLPYADHPGVRLSHARGYIPVLGYTMSRAEVVEVGNMLRHADLVITPGSTMTIEAAIFDTPVLVPVFHSYQPELAERYYRTRVFGRHFARIQRLNLVPIAWQPQELLDAINRSLREPEWYRAERAQLVRDYVQFADGRSTERLADLVVKLAGNGSRNGH